MAITYLEAIRSITQLTTSFVFELLEQQVVHAQQLTNILVKPSRKATRGASNAQLVTKADDAAQARVSTAQALAETADVAVLPRVATAHDAGRKKIDDAAQALVTPAGNAALALVSTVNEDRENHLRAERLVIDKQPVQHGETRGRTEIVTEMKSFDVPVSHEELVIDRHAVTGGVEVDSAPIAEETIRIPLTQQRVDLGKEAVVREEVEIGKRRVADAEHLSDAVRHEALRVDDATTNPATPRVNPEELVTTADDPAPVLVAMEGLTATSAENEHAVFHKRVQKRAYALWEAEGWPQGRQLDHWYQAERELDAMRPMLATAVERVLQQAA